MPEEHAYIIKCRALAPSQIQIVCPHNLHTTFNSCKLQCTMSPSSEGALLHWCCSCGIDTEHIIQPCAAAVGGV